MKNSRLIAIITIAALSVALTACSGNEANSTLEDGARAAKSTAVAEVTMSKETTPSIETVPVTEDEKPVETDEPPKPGTSIWKEVPVGSGPKPIVVTETRMPFDLKRIITGEYYSYNTFVFSGTIIGLKEYEHSWLGDDGEQNGPFRCSILEVEISKVYNGKSPVDGDIIRVFYGQSLSASAVVSHTPQIIEGGEYVFVNCWVLDEKYAEFNKKYIPGIINVGTEEYADVRFPGSLWNSLFPIEDGKVMFYNEFFAHDKNAKEKILTAKSIKTDMLTTSNSLEIGHFNAMNMADFEEAFLRLFENPESLPTP